MKQEFEIEMTLTIRPSRASSAYGGSADRLTLSDTIQLGERALPELLTIMGDLDAAIRQAQPADKATADG